MPLLSRRKQRYQSPAIFAPGSAFSPASLPNLVAWYKSDTGVTTSGGNVTQALDQSGHSYTLTNSGTVPFNATSGFNSNPAFDFDKANGAALFTGTSGTVVLPDVTRLSVFAVCLPISSSGIVGIVSIATGANPDYNDTGNIAALTWTAGAGGVISTDTPVFGVQSSVPASANYRLGVILDGTNCTQYVNNVAGGSTAATISLTSPTNVVVGNRWEGGGGVNLGAITAPILEVVIASHDLSSTERNNLDTYFTNKWGT